MNTTEIINLLNTNISDLEYTTDTDDLLVYAQDWSRFNQVNAAAILFPKSVKQVQSIIKLANKIGFKIVPSGGRTGYSGGAVASDNEFVLSLDKMGNILNFNIADSQVTIQAGVTTEQLHNFAIEQGLFYPVDFAASGSSQIGGNIATNAGGIRVLRYGMTRNYVAGLKVVTATGEVLDLNQGLIKNATGYDLRHLMIGSEGTLGIVLEATMQLIKPPVEQTVMLWALPSLDSVMRVFTLAKNGLNLSAYEFFTDIALNYVCQHRKLHQPFENSAPFYILCEFDRNEDAAMQVFEQGMEQNDIIDGIISQSLQQAQQIWQYREGISEAIAHFSPYKNDIAVKVSLVPEFMQKLNLLVKQYYPHFELVWFGHIGDGNLHLNIIKPADMSIADFKLECETVNQHVYGLIKIMDGSISAEHGVGLIKQPYLGYSRSAEEIKLLKGIKQLFDPNNILNPGKLL
ncbi:D-2-hydroxyglutarate dehydrogenase [hydrothermal vent metagenome]|uniref:D-2-hydroxyglutarate dehydrogenase n=1 Tax=hydrothermal vent metagenome TaxID=652676 RepID=A0A3B0VVL9_9ZZZZ